MTRTGTREELVGRLLAICVHPVAAWRRVSRLERQLIVLAYFSAGYLASLGSLLIWFR